MPKGGGFYRCSLTQCNPIETRPCCQVQDVYSGVRVTVKGRGTHGAIMPTLTQFLLRPVSASVTVLRSVGGVDGANLTPGTFSLVRENGTEH